MRTLLHTKYNRKILAKYGNLEQAAFGGDRKLCDDLELKDADALTHEAPPLILLKDERTIEVLIAFQAQPEGAAHNFVCLKASSLVCEAPIFRSR